MKRIVATGAVAALAMVGFAGTASAEPMGKGQVFKECFKANYGQSGLQYGQLKKDFPEGHPPVDPYGLPGVLAAHGPGGVELCVMDDMS